jgi:hypothetical protein
MTVEPVVTDLSQIGGSTHRQEKAWPEQSGSGVLREIHVIERARGAARFAPN